MRITDIPEFHSKKEVLSFTQDDTVASAARAMAKNKAIACVVTTKSGKVLGLFTETDLLMKVIGEDLDPKLTLLEQVVDKNIAKIKPEDSVIDTLRLMSKKGYNQLPIIDDKGGLIGILSQKDFVTLTWTQMAHHLNQDTRSSFLTYTTLWMLILSLVAYFSIITYWILRVNGI